MLLYNIIYNVIIYILILQYILLICLTSISLILLIIDIVNVKHK